MLKKFFALLLVLAMAVSVMSMATFAEETPDLPVIFVKDGGTGDGSSPDKALGYGAITEESKLYKNAPLWRAWDALLKAGGGTIVVCGEVSLNKADGMPGRAAPGDLMYNANYGYGGLYEQYKDVHITYTSVWGGVDYRETAGAKLQFDDNQMSLTFPSPTTLENITIAGGATSDRANYLCGNFYELKLGNGTNFVANATGKYPVIVGGQRNYNGITNIAGDTNIVVDIGAGNTVGDIYGLQALNAKDQTGNCYITVKSGTVGAIVGDGQHAGTKGWTGSINIAIEGGVIKGAVTVCNNGYAAAATDKVATLKISGGDFTNCAGINAVSKDGLNAPNEFSIDCSAAPKAVYDAVVAKTTLSVIAPAEPEPTDPPATEAPTEPALKEVEASLSFANKANRTELTNSKQVWAQNGITLTNNKAASTSNVADYSNPARFYASSELIVEHPGMTKIVFDCNNASYATALKNSISGATVSVSSDKVTVTFAEPVDSFKIDKLGAQVRMDSLTVTALVADEPTPTEPAPTNPPATEPAPTNPPATEPAPTDPPATEPAPTTPADPEAGSTLTIEEAIALGSSKEHNTYTTGKYYVTGVITEVYNTTYGNMKITDGNGNILTIYGTYSADGSTRYDKMSVKPVVGDTVTIYGIIGQYNGAAQIKNGWLTAHTPAEPAPTDPPATEPEATDPPATEPIPEGANKVTTIIKDYAEANGWTNGTAHDSITMDSVITVTATGTKVGDYALNTGKYYVDGNNWRIYQSEKANLTITANGATILTVKITYASQNTGTLTLNGENVASDAVIEVNAASITFGVGNTGTATNGQARITAIEVVYATAGSDAPVDPTEPEATEPEATEPEATEPEATEPEATEPDTAPEYTKQDSLTAGTAYKFGMLQGNVGKVFYLKGGMNGYYMDTTEDINEAIDVFVEETEGGYYFYTMVDGAKTYINMVVSGTHVNGIYEATASTVYTFKNGTLVAIVNDAEYWFGTRNDKTYTTMGPCAVSYAGFYGEFYAASSSAPIEPAPETGDSISAIVALMAVSALALAVVGMKKKEF